MHSQNSRPSVRKIPLRFESSRVSHGFTLVELMVTLVILSLLASVVTISVRGYLIRSKQSVARIEIGKIVQALEGFFTVFDRYPTNDEGLEILAKPSEKYPEPLLSFLPKDPWGHPYEYRSPADQHPFEIVSFGADHRQGGTGADLDISSVELGRSRERK